DDSFGAGQCLALKMSIQNKSISFNTETAYQPNSIGKMLVRYKNVDTIHFRIIKVDWDFYFMNKYYGEKRMEELLKKTPVEAWTKVFQDPKDYQSHSTEIKVTKKDFGQYVILASPNKEFKLEKNAIAYSSFWVTNLSFNYRRNDSTIDVYVTDRESGVPMKSVTASIFIKKYNYTSRKYEIKKQESYTTDANGMFIIQSRSEYRHIYIDLTFDTDQYNNAYQLYQYKLYKNDKSYSTTHFFTDRSIYRPGQTIYFKGVKIHHNGDRHTLETGKHSTVSFYDANYQKVADLKLTTNEYGTFSGSFTAPVGVLNGQMHIKDKHGNKYFSVEEYKRPKFQVDFEPIAGVYKIGQKIKITGTAKAFAGSTIDGAKVQYRVTRTASFPYWAWYRWGYYPQSPSVEIKNGELKTNEKGEFTIEFLAKEDHSVNSKFYPNYSYTVSADVTDVNGETHSASQSVMVGYNAMNLSLGINATIERNDKNRFKITTSNLNGEKVEASGTIKVTKLIEPKGLYRTSLWERPDVQEFSEEEYHKLFPHDAYKNENDPTKYDKGEQVFQISFNTANSDSVDFTGMKHWKPGRYVVESSSMDAFRQEVSDIHYITLLDRKDTKNPTNDIWSFTPLKVYCEPEENAEFLISSAAKGLKVLYEIEHKGKIVGQKTLSLTSSQKKITIPIQEIHRGNITVHFSTVKFGRIHLSKQAVIVPYSNKELDISFETFRNKLLPGQKEEWRLILKGPKGEKVAAEMLAAMYDASLDEFASNSFYMHVFNSYYSNKYWSSNSFGQKGSQLYYKDWNTFYAIPYRNYDYLNWWGYSPSYYGFSYLSRGPDRLDLIDGNYSLNALSDASVQEESNAEAPAQKAKAGQNEIKKAEFSEVSANTTKNDKEPRRELGQIKARSNLNETAFFYPQLETNEKGEIIIKFTIPEALTKWKFLGMAHTKDLKIGYIQKEVITQKELMVVPNAPRFLREGDKMTFTAKVSNLSDGDLDGSAQLMLFDALTMKPVDELFKNNNAIIDFTAKKDQSARLAWDIEVPMGIGA
ncbi:MAG: hypothetical protein JKY09_08915, partial [Crocinitomicaceae bacterium]|nr:hypothetical protein [Crocinitomicaceae bacterium]